MPLSHNSFVSFKQANPKRLNSTAAKRYDKYKSARTVREALALGALSADLQHDFRKGFLVMLSHESHATENQEPANSFDQSVKRPIACKALNDSMMPGFQFGALGGSELQQGTKRAFSEMLPSSEAAPSQRVAVQPLSYMLSKTAFATPKVRRAWKLRSHVVPRSPVDLEAEANQPHSTCTGKPQPVETDESIEVSPIGGTTWKRARMEPSASNLAAGCHGSSANLATAAQQESPTPLRMRRRRKSSSFLRSHSAQLTTNLRPPSQSNADIASPLHVAPPPVCQLLVCHRHGCSAVSHDGCTYCSAHCRRRKCLWQRDSPAHRQRTVAHHRSGDNRDQEHVHLTSPVLASVAVPSQLEYNQGPHSAWQTNADHCTPERQVKAARPIGSNESPCTVASSASPRPLALDRTLQREVQAMDVPPGGATCKGRLPKENRIPQTLQAQAVLSVSFRASEVAALIGLHCHGAPLAALVRCWGRHHKASLRCWERLTGGVSLPEVVFARHASTHVHAAVRAATRAGDGALPEDASAKIKAAVEASAPPALWHALTEEALGQARRARGTRLEVTGLNAYEQKFGRQVVRRNMDALRRLFPIGSADRTSVFAIAGRVDGFEEVSGKRWVVEHKRRQRRLFRQVPRYEEVQCQAYMAMTGTSACRWVQTLGPQVDVRSLARCPQRWACVEGRLVHVAQLLRRLCSGNLCPPSAELESMQRASWESVAPWPDGHAPAPADSQADSDSIFPPEGQPMGDAASGTAGQAVYVEGSLPAAHSIVDSVDRAPTKAQVTNAAAMTDVPVNQGDVDGRHSSSPVASSINRVSMTTVTHAAGPTESFADAVTLEAQSIHLATVATVIETQIQDTLKVMSPGTQPDTHQATLCDNDASTTEDEGDQSAADSTELDESELETPKSTATLLESGEGTS